MPPIGPNITMPLPKRTRRLIALPKPEAVPQDLERVDTERLIKLFLAGEPWASMARILGVTPKTVQYAATKAGLRWNRMNRQDLDGNVFCVSAKTWSRDDIHNWAQGNPLRAQGI